ncbi:MAG: sugar ABC transporter substrate-binding protein [Bacillota bacterium]|nr:sugar ABC transporter substrate-binding protein [Bacillota bacterium]
MKKRLLVLLLAVMMLMTTMICVSAEDTIITFMGWEASPLETKAVEDGIAKFEALNPGIKVQYTPGLAGAEYVAKLLSTVAGNSTPDVFFIAAENYRTFAEKGVLEEVTDKFTDKFSLDDFLPGAQDIMSIDGKVYGIQSCIVAPVVFYNKDIFDKLGEPYPDSDPANAYTAEEFRELAKRLTVKNGDTVETYGVYGLEAGWLTIPPFMLSNGVNLYSDDYMSSTFNTPETGEVLNWLRDIRVVDGSAPDATTLENIGMSAAQMLQTGKVAMIIDGSWALQQLAQMDFRVGVAPLPKFKEALTDSWAHLHAISAASKNKEAAWKFLEFLSGMEYQGALVAEGLWMPNRKSMYEPDAVKQWYREDIHGEDFLKMLDYFRDSRVAPLALQKSSKCQDVMTEETDMFFKDGQPLDITLKNVQDRVNEILKKLK